MKSLVLFPHQLYFDFPESIDQETVIYLVEEHLFFRQYPFHKQKLIFHRASMKAYAEVLQNSGSKLVYVDALKEIADIRKLVPYLKNEGFDEIICFEPDDFLLNKRLQRTAEQVGCSLIVHSNQLFINTIDELELYKKDHKRLFQTDFYIHQRKKRNILLDELGGPLGGKWSFDADNRKKYPSSKTPPSSPSTSKTAFHIESESYVEKHFAQNYGELKAKVHYPSHYRGE